ncbi:hypothetical protein ABZS66_12580 [Dactylosporangium sp. NPDC005572]|uniref:hypothetical protein n=1 Tax=Dactylosporangium sp. NPDC005572 TaxID=3156889 RepID=UPI0033BCCDBD
MNQPHDPFDDLQDWAKEAERRQRRAHRWRSLRHPAVRNTAFVVSAAVAAVVLAAAIGAVRSPDDAGEPAAAYPTQSVPEGVTATTSASAVVVSGPFDGTPAAAYPKGEAGITMPPATAVAGFTVAQVQAALAQVRAALVAGRLDRTMLVGHDPSAFLALLAPNIRDDIQGWFTKGRHSGVATWVDPSVTLDPAEPPRVSGRVTFAAATIDDVPTLQVTTNFVWVYAFTGGAQPIAAVHDEIRWDFPTHPRLRKGDEGVWIGNTSSYLAWINCAAAAKGLLAPDRGTGGAAPAASEDPDAFLRPDHALAITDGCAGASPGASAP